MEDDEYWQLLAYCRRHNVEYYEEDEGCPECLADQEERRE